MPHKTEWLDALPHRVTKGAYRFNDALAGFMSEATDEEIDDFYLKTQTTSPSLLAALEAEGLLIEARLDLKDKVAALF